MSRPALWVADRRHAGLRSHPGCAVLRFFGQPMVVSDMIAGLLLGPASPFGLIAPDMQQALFQNASPPRARRHLQVRLALFMLIVGAELRLPAGAKAQITPPRLGQWAVSAVADAMALVLAAAVPAVSTDARRPSGVAFWSRSGACSLRPRCRLRRFR